MRITLGFLLIIAGCGDNTSATDDMAVQMDLTPGPDLTMPSQDLTPANLGDMTYFHQVDGGGPNCGNSTCSPGQFCCVTGLGGGGSPTASCATSCADGGLAIQCNGPAQCGGDPCCITLMGFNASSVSCTASASACPAMFSTTPGATNQTRACNYDGDCTAGLTGTQMYPDCCHATSNPTQHFCFSKSFVGFTGGQVTCP